jgi:acetoacetyl-CoA synthetase
MHLFEETICIGQRRPTDKDEQVILFVKMKPGRKLDAALRSRIKDEIRKALSPRHVPKYIFEVPEIPYTINGKKVELAVKRIVSGIKNAPSSAVANPECFKYYEPYFHVEQRAREQEEEDLKIPARSKL